MKKIRGNLVALLIALVGLACSSIVHAQATRTWVSGVGDDVNPCSRTAPCKTFAGAISKTAAGGEISVLDPGGFGAVTVTKSITIDGGSGAGFGSILNSSTYGVLINAANTDKVTLRNLSINGATTGLIGVKILAAGSVFIENCQIFGNLTASPNGRGISDQRAVGGLLSVKDTVVRNNSAFGIIVLPGSGITNASINGVLLTANGSAGLSASVGSNVVLTNSVVAGNTGSGVYVEMPYGTTSIFVADSTISGNGNGLFVASGSPAIRIANNIITANNVGVVPGGVSITSLGGNKISGNTSGNGAPFSPPFTQVSSQ